MAKTLSARNTSRLLNSTAEQEPERDFRNYTPENVEQVSDKLLLKTQEPQGNRAEQGTDDPKQNVPQGSEAFSA